MWFKGDLTSKKLESLIDSAATYICLQVNCVLVLILSVTCHHEEVAPKSDSIPCKSIQGCTKV
jgi:hypothetical protein